MVSFFFFQAEDGIRDYKVTGVQTCALPISGRCCWKRSWRWPATGGPAIKRPTGFAWGRRVGEDGWIVTRDTYRLPGRSTCIRWCRSFVRFCKGRAEQARGSDELPGPQRRSETGETGAETSGERTTQTSGCRGDRKSTRLNSSHLVISYAVFCLK